MVDQQLVTSEYQLINLYTNNLCTVAIQSSVIAGLAYAAINNIYEMTIISNSILAYGYHAVSINFIEIHWVRMTHPFS